jgi:hypothetical protein
LLVDNEEWKVIEEIQVSINPLEFDLNQLDLVVELIEVLEVEEIVLEKITQEIIEIDLVYLLDLTVLMIELDKD